VGKLLGFDFTVEYKPGAANVVVDALSRRDTDEGSIIAISGPRFDFVSRLHQAQVKMGMVRAEPAVRRTDPQKRPYWAPPSIHETA